jgi:TRAP-type C4-dicarboxylate transport system permease small subunit
MLYLITLLPAPWLMHQGQHIRVDILLHQIPKRMAWYCEWVADVLALVCCMIMMFYSTRALIESYDTDSMTIKTLVTPEWWWLVPLPSMFFLLGIEMVFRMRRLSVGERAPRTDFVAASVGTNPGPVEAITTVPSS